LSGNIGAPASDRVGALTSHGPRAHTRRPVALVQKAVDRGRLTSWEDGRLGALDVGAQGLVREDGQRDDVELVGQRQLVERGGDAPCVSMRQLAFKSDVDIG